MRLLLDTHTFIWYVTDNPRLSAKRDSETGFLPNTSLSPTDSVKNPVPERSRRDQ